MLDYNPMPDWWALTVGGAEPGDPRDGEIHAGFGRLRDHMDIEPWENSADGRAWRHARDSSVPVEDRNGRPVHTFRFEGRA